MKKNQAFSVRIRTADLPEINLSGLKVGSYGNVLGGTDWIMRAVSTCLDEIERNHTRQYLIVGARGAALIEVKMENK